MLVLTVQYIDSVYRVGPFPDNYGFHAIEHKRGHKHARKQLLRWLKWHLDGTSATVVFPRGKRKERI